MSLWNEPNDVDFLQKITVSDPVNDAAPAASRNGVYFYQPGWA